MPKFNPYRPGKAVNPGMFSGRLNEVQNMERGLFQTKNGNCEHYLIEGERGIGKTSLLLYLDWVARGLIDVEGNKFNFVVLTAELREGMGSEEIIDCLLTRLRTELSSKEKLKELCKKTWDFLSNFEVMGVSYGKNSSEIPTEKFDELTNSLIDVLENGKSAIDGVVLLIDEADRPQGDAKLGEICKLLTERLTRQGLDKISIILAGLPGLIGKLREGHESSPRIFTVMPLEPLEPKECEYAIKAGLNDAEKKNGFKTEIQEDAIKLLCSLSEGYPHFLQEFSFWAFENDADNNITRDDVINGAFSENGAIDQLGQKYYAEMYIGMIGSEEYRKVLGCMADSFDGWVERQHLIDNSGVKPSTIDNALRTLKEKRIILSNPARQGQYRLPTKSFAIWIKIREGGRSAANMP